MNNSDFGTYVPLLFDHVELKILGADIIDLTDFDRLLLTLSISYADQYRKKNVLCVACQRYFKRTRSPTNLHAPTMSHHGNFAKGRAIQIVWRDTC